MAKVWQALQAGDIVDIIAPAMTPTEGVVEKSVAFLKSWGLRPRIPKGFIRKLPYLSNTDEKRSEHLRKALNGDAKVIWCLRGGYGSIRLLETLAGMKEPANPKLLIGISDITSLQTYLITHWNWPCLHGAMLDRFVKDRVSNATLKETKNILFGKSTEVVHKKLKPMNDAAKKVKDLRGSVFGGNMTTLQSKLGTPFDFGLKDRFFFLEDLGERGYRIDRMLTHFKLAGKFKNCRAVLFGHITEGLEPDKKNDYTQVAIKDFAKSVNIPVFTGIESGHDENLRPLFYNTESSIRYNKGFEIVTATGVKKS